MMWADSRRDGEPAVAKGKRQLRARFYVALITSDVAAILLGCLLARLADTPEREGLQVWTLLAAVLPLFLLQAVRNLCIRTLENWQWGAARAVGALLVAVLITTFAAFLFRRPITGSRALVVLPVLLSGGLLVAFRGILGLWTERLFSGSATSRLLILDRMSVPVPPGTRTLRADRFDLAEEGAAHPDTLDRLARALAGVDEVFVACPPERRAGWAAALKGSTVKGELLVPELDAVGVIGNEHFAGVATVLVSAGGFHFRDRVLKRTLDLAIALPAVFFLAPLLALVAVAIRLDSDGPILFRQKRVGYGNRMFTMFKFRSMRVEMSDSTGARSASRDDDRITGVGRFIRSTSIDELPQLFNILRGEMSFVGPRPHAIGSLAGNQLFWEVDSRYHHRHACKPGLTGLAQVRGFRGATHRREDLIERLNADLEYVNGWSLGRDLMILLATVRVVVHRNAF
jgi:polysaccharide biosynthesis protein PslA